MPCPDQVVGLQRPGDPIESVALPTFAHEAPRRRIHVHIGRPLARITLRRILARRVDADLRTVGDAVRSVIEIVDRTGHRHDVTFGREIVEHVPSHFARRCDVDVGVYDDENAREHHHMARAPKRVHHFLRLAGIGFANRDDREVMKAAFDRKIHVDDFGQHASAGAARKMRSVALPSHASSIGGLPTTRCRIDGIAAMRDAGHVKGRIVIRRTVDAGVIAERSFHPQILIVNVTLEHELRFGRDHQIDRLVPA